MYKRWIASFRGFIKEDRKYIYTFLYSQIFVWSFFILNNSKGKFSRYVIKEYLKASESFLGIIAGFVLLSVFFRMVFPKKYKICILILILLNFLGNSLDMLVYLNFGTQISPEMMNIFFESNLNEAKEFTNSYLNKKILLLIPYYIIGGLLLIKIKTKIFIKMLALTFATIILAINILKIEGSTYFRKTYIYKNISRSYSRYKKSA
ncbi:MAG: hypothetical protein RR438_09220, partial [Cetobacterium sp.]